MMQWSDLFIRPILKAYNLIELNKILIFNSIE